jgi:hypothetical protein
MAKIKSITDVVTNSSSETFIIRKFRIFDENMEDPKKSSRMN